MGKISLRDILFLRRNYCSYCLVRKILRKVFGSFFCYRYTLLRILENILQYSQYTCLIDCNLRLLNEQLRPYCSYCS